jgi:hypothetical protein
MTAVGRSVGRCNGGGAATIYTGVSIYIRVFDVPIYYVHVHTATGAISTHIVMLRNNRIRPMPVPKRRESQRCRVLYIIIYSPFGAHTI